ncbi:MAG: tRNA pseudouridine(13) synthase TruD, partial [Gammaproteobacteria bacterium]
QQRGFALSAARSQIFNALLSARVRAGTWCHLLPGDLAVLQGSRSLFPVTDVDATLEQRIETHDIHPSGPMWGRGHSASEGEAARLEESVAGDWPQCVAVVSAAGMDHERRALRLTVADLHWSFEGAELVLGFSLCRGGFATAVLRELLEFSEGDGAQPFLRNNT